MLIDTHAHLDGEEFASDLADVVVRAKEAGIGKILVPNVSSETLPNVDEVCRRYSGYLYPMIGLHPENIGTKDENDSFIDMMRERLSAENPYVAIGEVGLDFYWDDSRRDEQERVFAAQVELASEFGLPLMIHARSAHESLMREMELHRDENLKGVFHCFSGSAEDAEQLLSFPGFVLGIGGISTFKKSALPDVLSSSVPLSRVVIETDSPYMSPVPHRGKRNESAYVADIADKLALIYGVERSEVERTTTDNVYKVFGKLEVASGK